MPPKTRAKQCSPSRQGNVDVTKDDCVADLLSEEGKLILSLISEKLDTAVCEILSKISEKDIKMGQLEQKICSLESVNKELRLRLDDVEAEQRGDSLILSGKSLPTVTEGEVTSEVVCSTLKQKLKYNLPINDISASFRLGRKPMHAPDKRDILIRLRHRDLKESLLISCKTAKPSDLYINENLIPSRSTILFALRKAKKRFPDVIDGCGSMNGRVYVWLRSSNVNGKRVKTYVNCSSDLDDLCKRSLDISSSELLHDQSSK